MKVSPLLNDNGTQLVIEAESPLEMGLLKRFALGKNGNGDSFGAGYGNNSGNSSYGYDHISLVSYDQPLEALPSVGGVE